MLTQDYLSLRLHRLRRGEEWTPRNNGLSFVFPKGGGGRFCCGTVAGRLSPGDVLVMDRAPCGKLCVSDADELLFWWFSMCSEHLFPLFASSEICLVQSVMEEFKGAKLYPASSPTSRQTHRLLASMPPQFDLDHRTQLLRVAAAILATEFKNAHSRRVGFIRAEEHMTQVFEKLSASDILNLSVAELAQRFGCSRRHLNRLFHHHFSVSVATLKMEMRLLKAVSLLRDPNAKVIRVAEEAGFNHLGLFNICFKRRFGVSPSQWRNNAMPPEMRTSVLGDGAPNCPMSASGLCPWYGRGNGHKNVVQGAPEAASPCPVRAWNNGFDVQQDPNQSMISCQEAARNRRHKSNTLSAGP